MAQISTNHFAKAAPNELSRHAGEEDVFRVFGNTAEGVDARAWAISLANLNSGRNPTANPLPHVDPDLQRQADGPNRREGEGAEEGAMDR